MNDFDARTYWETRLKNNYGPRGVGYYRLGKYYNQWLYKIRRHVFNRKLKQLNIDAANMNILDIGSGTGFYIDRWQELGAKNLSGSDLTSVAVNELSSKYSNIPIFQLDIGDQISIFNGQTFDVVSGFDVLFHIIDDSKYEQAIKNISSLLKPGGLFIFSEYFVHQDTIRDNDRVKHQTSRSLVQIEKLLRDNGLEILDRSPMLYLMNTPIDTKSRIIKLSWLSMSVIISLNEYIGYLIGALLYPIEQGLVDHLKESPSVEIMVCRKR